MRLGNIVAELFLPVDVLHHARLMVIAPHLAVAHQYEQAVGARVSEFHFGKQTVGRHGKCLRCRRLWVVAYQHTSFGAQPQFVVFVGERLRYVGCLLRDEAWRRAFGKRVETRRGGEEHPSVHYVDARHGRAHALKPVIFCLAVVGVNDVYAARCRSGAYILPLLLEARKAAVAVEPAEQPAPVLFGYGVNRQTLAQPIDVAAVLAQYVGLQFHCGRVGVPSCVEYLSHHDVPSAAYIRLKDVLAARKQQDAAVVHGLNLYHLHVARLLLQFVVYVAVSLGILVKQVQMVVRVAYPQISVLVAYDVAHLARRHVRLVAYARYEGRKLRAVERAQAVPCAEPHKAVAVLMGTIHRVARQSVVLGVVFHNHVGLCRGCGGI